MNNATVITADQTSEIRRDVERLKADLRQIRTDLAEVAGHAIELGKTDGVTVRDRLALKARAAASKGRESIEAVGDQISTHPFASVAVAVAVGAAAGAVIARKA